MTASIGSAAPVRFHDAASSGGATSPADVASFATHLTAVAAPFMVASQPKQCPPKPEGRLANFERYAVSLSNEIKYDAQDYVNSTAPPHKLMEDLNSIGFLATYLTKDAQKVRLSPDVVSRIRPELESARKVLSNAPAIDDLTGKDLADATKDLANVNAALAALNYKCNR